MVSIRSAFLISVICGSDKRTLCYHSMRFCVSLSKNITGAKFLFQCPGISRDNIGFVIVLHTVTTCNVIICVLLSTISLEGEKIILKNTILLHIDRLFRCLAITS